MLNLRTAVEQATERLADVSSTPRLDAEALVRHVSGTTRADLIAHPEQSLPEAAGAALAQLLERRRQGEPIAYLLGRREFWSLDLQVSPDTLIPRPDTELLVERALARIPPAAEWRIADLGTGSGAIALAIARERPHAQVTATDRSEAALAVARANAQRLGIVNLRFHLGDWLAPLAGQRFNLIVSNPPYLRADDPHLHQGDLRFEPRAALVAGPTGLEAIRHIAAAARAHLLPGGGLLLEHGFDQAEAVRAVLAGGGYRDIGAYRDLAGHMRVTEAFIP